MKFILEESELDINRGICVLYFYAPWLIYHKKMMAMFDKIMPKYNKIKFFGIDINYFKKYVMIYDVKSIPTVVIFYHGIELKRITGICLTSALKSIFIEITSKFSMD